MSHEARDDRPRPSLLPEVDRGIIRGEAGLDIIRGLQGGVIQVDGWIDDDLAFTRDWGFDPRELTVPTYIWHGSADLMAPFHHAEWLATKIPGAVPSFGWRGTHFDTGRSLRHHAGRAGATPLVSSQ
jgi:pimeloyl-ACP methyl ester carboxylesterase